MLTARLTRAPQIRRDSTSRPSESAPSQWSGLGPESGLATPVWSGSYGEITGASSATAIRPATIATPRTPAGSRRNSRSVDLAADGDATADSVARLGAT